MKKLLYAIPLAAVLFISLGASFALASDPFAMHFSSRNSDDTADVTTDLTPSDTVHNLIATNPSTHLPELWNLDSSEFAWDPGLGILSLYNMALENVAGLQDALDAHTSAIATKVNSSTYMTAVNGLHSELDNFIYPRLTYVQNRIGTSTQTVEYFANATTTTANRMIFTGTTSSGTATFYLTKDGTSTGAPVCSGTPVIITSVDDPANTYGVGTALTNSNKTLTITANVRSFSATTILGISVLGASSLAAATNGTAIKAFVDCQ